METICQASYPLNSENASPPGTFRVYLSCAEIARPPTKASTPVIIGIVSLLAFIASTSFLSILSFEVCGEQCAIIKENDCARRFNAREESLASCEPVRLGIASRFRVALYPHAARRLRNGSGDVPWRPRARNQRFDASSSVRPQ